MSMALALEGTRDYLRTQNSWTFDQCNIQQNAAPPPVSPQFYVALDDGGVEADNEGSYFFRERYTMIVGVWFRVGAYPEDTRGIMQLKTDIYRASISTLNKLERQVIQKTHNSFALVTQINTDFSLPVAADGDLFQSPWVYQGRSANELLGLPDQNGNVYLGRRLRFRGLLRIQIVDSIQ